jgi:hypothetical protein
MFSSSDRGQATVEAAVMLPVLMTLVLMVCQPAIMLYDRVIMQGAAAETCRLLVTSTGDDGRFDTDSARDYVLRRLGGIPPLDIFHIHDGGCYQIELEGAEGSAEVTVTIVNRMRLLPLIGQAATLLGVSEGGVYELEVSVSMPARAEWVQGSVADWMGVWD